MHWDQRDSKREARPKHWVIGSGVGLAPLPSAREQNAFRHACLLAGILTSPAAVLLQCLGRAACSWAGREFEICMKPPVGGATLLTSYDEV